MYSSPDCLIRGYVLARLAESSPSRSPRHEIVNSFLKLAMVAAALACQVAQEPDPDHCFYMPVEHHFMEAVENVQDIMEDCVPGSLPPAQDVDAGSDAGSDFGAGMVNWTEASAMPDPSVVADTSVIAEKIVASINDTIGGHVRGAVEGALECALTSDAVISALASKLATPIAAELQDAVVDSIKTAIKASTVPVESVYSVSEGSARDPKRRRTEAGHAQNQYLVATTVQRRASGPPQHAHASSGHKPKKEPTSPRIKGESSSGNVQERGVTVRWSDSE